MGLKSDMNGLTYAVHSVFGVNCVIAIDLYIPLSPFHVNNSIQNIKHFENTRHKILVGSQTLLLKKQ
jgi:hypothetical protein